MGVATTDCDIRPYVDFLEVPEPRQIAQAPSEVRQAGTQSVGEIESSVLNMSAVRQISHLFSIEDPLAVCDYFERHPVVTGHLPEDIHEAIRSVFPREKLLLSVLHHTGTLFVTVITSLPYEEARARFQELREWYEDLEHSIFVHFNIDLQFK